MQPPSDIAAPPPRPLMARKNRTLLRLAAAALALGTAAALVERFNAPRAGAARQGPASLLDTTEGVLGLTLELGDRRIALERRDDLWRLTAPYAAFADPEAVNALLNLLASLERVEQIDAAQRRRRDTPLAAYGFETPRARLRLRWGDRERVLRVGDDRPLSDRLYARWDDEEVVCVVAADLLARLPPSAGALASRRLLHGVTAGIVRIEVAATNVGAATVYERDGDQWRIRAPFAAPAQSGALDAWIEAWMTRPVIAFAEQAPVTGTLGAAASVRLFRREGDAIDLRLYPAPAPDAPAPLLALVTDAPPAYVPVEALHEIPVVAAAWRSRRLCHLDAENVRGLLVRRGETRARLWRDEAGAWLMEEPWRQVADSNAVAALVRGLATGRWERLAAVLPDTHVTPPSPTDWFVVLCTETQLCRDATTDWPAVNDAHTAVLRLSPAGEADTHLVQVGGEPGRYSVPPGWLAGLGLDPLDPAGWLDRTVLTIAPEQVHRIVQSRDGQTLEIVRADDGRWIADPPDREVDVAAVERLLTALAPLRTLRYEIPSGAPEEDARLGLRDERDAVSLSLRAGAGIRKTIVLGARRADGARYARLQGHDWVITLAPAVADALMAPLRHAPSP